MSSLQNLVIEKLINGNGNGIEEIPCNIVRTILVKYINNELKIVDVNLGYLLQYIIESKKCEYLKFDDLITDSYVKMGSLSLVIPPSPKLLLERIVEISLNEIETGRKISFSKDYVNKIIKYLSKLFPEQVQYNNYVQALLDHTECEQFVLGDNYEEMFINTDFYINLIRTDHDIFNLGINDKEYYRANHKFQNYSKESKYYISFICKEKCTSVVQLIFKYEKTDPRIVEFLKPFKPLNFKSYF